MKTLRCVALLVVVFPAVAARASAQPPPATPLSPDVVKALHVGGLPGAARLVGHFVEINDGDGDWVLEGATDLFRLSDTVVRGSIVSRLPARIEPGSHNLVVSTDYTVFVTERFKGVMEAGVQLTFLTLGGFVQFSNLTTAEIRSERNPQIQVGDDCVLFLRRVDTSQQYFGPARMDTSQLFGPALGPEGMFAFAPDGRTLSRARSSAPVFKKYQGMPRDEFLEVIRSSVIP